MECQKITYVQKSVLLGAIVWLASAFVLIVLDPTNYLCSSLLVAGIYCSVFALKKFKIKI
jgi:hypothetical protein